MAYTYSRAITIDHTKCGAADSTNWVYTFNRTDVGLKSVGNSGHIQNSLSTPTRPADLVFSPNADGSSPYAFEITFWNPATGLLRARVKIPTLSHTTDNVFYLVYGDASVTTFQGNVASTYNSNIKGVYHLGDGTTLSVADSLAAHNGTNVGTATAGAGQIDGAAVLNGSSQFVDIGAAGMALSKSTPFSVSAWIKSNVTSEQAVVTDWNISTTAGWVLSTSIVTGSKLGFALLKDDGGSNVVAEGGTSVCDNALHHVAFTYDGSQSHGGSLLYVDGVAETMSYTDTGSAYSGIGSFGNDSLRIGSRRVTSGAGANASFSGSIGEVYIFDDARPASWITATYQNQKNPSSGFDTLAAEPSGAVSVSVSFAASATFAPISLAAAPRTVSFAASGAFAPVAQTLDITFWVRAPYLESDMVGTKTVTIYDYTTGSQVTVTPSDSKFTAIPSITNGWWYVFKAPVNDGGYGGGSYVCVFANINSGNRALEAYNPPTSPPASLKRTKIASFRDSDTITTPGYQLYTLSGTSIVTSGGHVATTGFIAITGITNGYAVCYTITPDANYGAQRAVLWDGA